MKISALIEAKVSLSFFYHATHAKNLRSIMLYGLDPARIKDGPYADLKPINSATNWSVSSYGGIYLSRSFSNTIRYAYEQDFIKSNPLIVIVKAKENLPIDEDFFRFELSWALQKSTWITSKAQLTALVTELLRSKLDHSFVPSLFNQLQSSFIDDFIEHFDKQVDNQLMRRLQDAKRNRSFRHIFNLFFEKAILRAFVVEKAQRLSLLAQNLAGLLTNVNSKDITALVKLLLNRPLIEIERDFVSINNKLALALNNLLEEKQSAPTARSLNPIRFKGPNYITTILEIAPGLFDTRNNSFSLLSNFTGTPSATQEAAMALILHYGEHKNVMSLFDFNSLAYVREAANIAFTKADLPLASQKVNLLLVDKQNRVINQSTLSMLTKVHVYDEDEERY